MLSDIKIEHKNRPKWISGCVTGKKAKIDESTYGKYSDFRHSRQSSPSPCRTANVAEYSSHFRIGIADLYRYCYLKNQTNRKISSVHDKICNFIHFTGNLSNWRIIAHHFLTSFFSRGKIGLQMIRKLTHLECVESYSRLYYYKMQIRRNVSLANLREKVII